MESVSIETDREMTFHNKATYCSTSVPFSFDVSCAVRILTDTSEDTAVSDRCGAAIAESELESYSSGFPRALQEEREIDCGWCVDVSLYQELVVENLAGTIGNYI